MGSEEGRLWSEEERLRELLEWLKARTNPETIAMILKDVRAVSLKRTTRWVIIFGNLNKSGQADSRQARGDGDSQGPRTTTTPRRSGSG
jgi:hypothetical protein